MELSKWGLNAYFGKEIRRYPRFEAKSENPNRRL